MSLGESSLSSKDSFWEIRDRLVEQDSDEDEVNSSEISQLEFSRTSLSPEIVEMSNQVSVEAVYPQGVYQTPEGPGAVPQAASEQTTATRASAASQAGPSLLPSGTATQHPASLVAADTVTILPALLSLPQPYSRDAPRTFKGSYAKVEGWLSQYEKMAKRYGVKDGRDKCEGLLDYCSLKVKRTIRTLTSFRAGSWETFKQDILKLYDAARARQQFQPSDIQALARKQVNQPIDNLSKWLKYRRRFQEKGGELVPAGKMTEQQLATYFWLGIPELLRKLLEIQLCAKFPQRDNTVPYPIQEVSAAAEQYFNRSHFVSTVPDAEAFGTVPREEDSGDDSGSEDDSESDMEELELWRKLFKGKVKDRTKGREGGEEVPPMAPRAAPASSVKERIRTTQFTGSQAEVAELISRLNGMQLDNPEYGALYYRATALDPNSRACIARSPIVSAPAVAPATPYIHPNGGQRPLVPVTTDGQTVKMIPFEKRPPTGPRFACNGCSSLTHRMSECPGIVERQRKGELKWDSNVRKLVTAEGKLVERRSGENLLQALDRMLSEMRATSAGATSQAMLYKMPEAVQQHFRERGVNAFLGQVPGQDDISEEEEDEGDEEEQSYEGEWEEDFDETELSSEEEEEEDYVSQGYESAATLAAVLHAERTTPRGKDARMRTSAGPREGFQEARIKRHVLPPRKADGTRPTWQESVGAAKRKPAGRAPAPRATAGSPPPRTLPADIFDETSQVPSASADPSVPKNSFPSPREPMTDPPPVGLAPKIRGTDIPLHPKPYDARQPLSARRATSLEPGQRPRSVPNESRTKPIVRFTEPETPQFMAESREREERAPRGARPERRTELARRVDKQGFIERLLDTQVQVTLGEVLGTSRELSSAFHDLSKVKMVQGKPPTTRVSHVNTIVSPGSGRVMLTKNARLIEFYLEFNGQKIRAILDTGSQINVMSTAVYEDVIRLPIDLREYTIMNDANGGVSRLEGAVDDVPLKCGSVETRGFYFVGDSVPFSLLLGRPWIADNAVSIDERRNGTYLVFKDPETWTPVYEMLVSTRPGRGPHYRLGSEQERHMRSYHVGLAQDKKNSDIEEVSDSELDRRSNPDNATELLGGTMPSGSDVGNRDDESIDEIHGRQPSFSPTPAHSATPRLYPTDWPGMLEEEVRWGRTPEEESEDSAWTEGEGSNLGGIRPTQDLAANRNELLGFGEAQMKVDAFLLIKVWLRIWVVASATLLLRLCHTMDRLIREQEEDKREDTDGEEDPTTISPSSHHCYLLTMSSSSSSSSESREASPLALPPSAAPVAASDGSSPSSKPSSQPPSRAALEQRAAGIPVLPVLTNPGPLHHPPFNNTLSPNGLIREACFSSINSLATSGNIPTRPAIAVSPQAYYVQERNRPGIGPSQTYVALNAGLIVYNPELQRSSHQQGHLYMEFFPRTNALPLAPQAAENQTFNYLFEPALLPSGARNAHQIDSSDVHMVARRPPKMGGPSPTTNHASTCQPASEKPQEEGELDGDIPILVDVPSDMEIDSSSGTDTSDDSAGIAPMLLAAAAGSPPASAGLKVPESLPKPPFRPGRPVPTFAPDSPPPPTSLALVPRRAAPSPLTGRGRTLERRGTLPSRPTSHPDRLLAGPILELTRRLPREHVGDPIFTIAEGPCQTPDWQFTSLFRMENGAILAESKKTLQERLITALSPVSAEIYYGKVEEGMEGCWGPTDDPDFIQRMQYHEKLQSAEARQLMVSKFHYRVGVARGQAIQPIILSPQTFDAKEFQVAWMVRNIPATEAGRWKYRKLLYVYINQELFRFMVMFAEFLMLRNLDHVFRARYHAYRGAHRFVTEKHGNLLGNRLLTWDVRIWLLVAWEMLVFLREVELAALVNTILRIRYLDSESLDNLHRGHYLPELPSELPGTYIVSWDEVMYPMESYESFIGNVFQTPHISVGPNYVNEHIIDSDAETVPKENVTILQLKYPIPASPVSTSSSSSASSAPNVIEVEL